MMPKDMDGCTCWLSPSTNGEANPSAWLTMHHEVEMHAIDGRSMRGLPYGVHLESGKTVSHWNIEVDDGNGWFLPLDEVVAIDPTPSLSHVDMINQILNAIANPVEVPDEGLNLRFIVGAHESIEVSLQLQRWQCEPH